MRYVIALALISACRPDAAPAQWPALRAQAAPARWWCEIEPDGACFRAPEGCAKMGRGTCIQQGSAACFDSLTPDYKVDVFCISTFGGCQNLRNFMIANAKMDIGIPRGECAEVE